MVLWAAWDGIGGGAAAAGALVLGRQLGFGVGFWFGVRFEVEEDLGPEV